MALSPAQLATLKAAILADPVLAAYPAGAASSYPIAEALNAAATPPYWVWRTALPKHELTNKVSVDGTSFIWAGNGFIGRSPGEIACWNELFNSTLTCNPSLPNVRQAFSDIFSGAGNAASNRAHLLVASRRKATIVEKLYIVPSSGDGSTTTPATMGWEGPVSPDEVQQARELP